MNDQESSTSSLYAVIMAGGRGTRFWPLSRENHPKQFLDLTGRGTMIGLTWNRLRSLLPADQILVVAGEDHRSAVFEALRDLPETNYIAEPVGRNTAPCIGLAARLLAARDSRAVMAVLPADHLIEDEDAFRRAMDRAAFAASRDEILVTFGMSPSRPHTGYGYIEKGEKLPGQDLFEVVRFTEKPDLASATAMVESGDYLWNSGMFVWRVEVILKELAEHLPETGLALDRIGSAYGTNGYQEVLSREYSSLEPVSIDYGVMEKSRRVVVIEGDFGWNDVGSWTSLDEMQPSDDEGNVSMGDLITHDSHDNIVHAPEKLVAMIGIDGIVVVDTGDSILIADKDRVQDVRKVTEELRRRNRKDLL